MSNTTFLSLSVEALLRRPSQIHKSTPRDTNSYFLCTFQGVAMRAFLFKLKNINSCDNALLPRTIDASVVELDLLSATVVWP